MYLLSTTTCWNPGDDLIRDGVLRLAVPPGAPVAWASRTQCQGDKGWVPLWRAIYPREYMPGIAAVAKAFILAGTPEWTTGLFQLYADCRKAGTPVWIIGVGGPQRDWCDHVALTARTGLIRVATTRDPLGEPLLDALGIPYRRFLCPGWHGLADWPAQEPKEGLVFNPKLESPGQVEFWAALYWRFRPYIRSVIVHEGREYASARAICPKHEVFFDSDYRAYRAVYAGAGEYLGGRMHGAMMAAWQGAAVHLVRSDAKHEAVRDWPGVSCRLYDPAEALERGDVGNIPPTNRRELEDAVAADFAAHRAYITERVGEKVGVPA